MLVVPWRTDAKAPSATGEANAPAAGAGAGVGELGATAAASAVEVLVPALIAAAVSKRSCKFAGGNARAPRRITATADGSVVHAGSARGSTRHRNAAFTSRIVDDGSVGVVPSVAWRVSVAARAVRRVLNPRRAVARCTNGWSFPSSPSPRHRASARSTWATSTAWLVSLPLPGWQAALSIVVPRAKRNRRCQRNHAPAVSNSSVRVGRLLPSPSRSSSVMVCSNEDEVEEDGASLWT